MFCLSRPREDVKRRDRRSVKLSPTLGLCFALSNASSFASRVNGPHLRNISHHHLIPHKTVLACCDIDTRSL